MLSFTIADKTFPITEIRFTQLREVALSMEINELFGPVGIGFFRPRAVVSAPNCPTQPIQESEALRCT